MKLYEIIAGRVACDDDPDGMNGAIDEKGAGGFWDFAGHIAGAIDDDPDKKERAQDIIYSAIKLLLKDL